MQISNSIDTNSIMNINIAEFLKKTQGITVNENSIFDVQVKRLHEYKRQQMNALYVNLNQLNFQYK